MQVRIVCILILFLSSLSVFSQIDLKLANDYFQFGNYENALKSYEYLYEKDTTNADVIYKLGVCHLILMKDRSKAVPFLEKASTMKGVIDFVWFDLGSAYRYTHQFDKSNEALTKFLSLTRNSTDKELCELMLIQNKNAQQLLKSPHDVEFINLGSNVNSIYDDFAPYVSRDNEWMFFNSNRIFNKVEDMYIVNVHNVEFKRNKWRQAGRSKYVNSAEDNVVAGMSASEDIIFVKPMRYTLFGDIISAPISDGNISGRSYTLPAPINTRDEESGATLSPTGDTLIFSSDRKGGEGGLDLYMSIKLPDNSWGTPQNLGSHINSKFHEDFPMFSADGKTLWFASNGPASMGGFDIFVSKWNASEGRWSSPRNLGYPINSLYDNLAISYTNNERYAYVSDVRSEGYGGMDIYQVVFKKEARSIYILRGIINKGTASEPILLTDSDLVQIALLDFDSKDVIGKYKFDYSSNSFFAAIPPGKYILKVESSSCIALEYEFDIADMHATEEFEIETLFLNSK